MRKALSTILLTLAVFFGQSQVILNEIYTDPGDGKQEFFELYNTSSQQVNLDCYTLVTIFEQNNKLGLYVLNLPNLSVNAKSHFVGAASNPFNVQQKTNQAAAFSWNNLDATGSLTGYIVNNNNTGYDNYSIPSNLNDLFTKINGQITGGVAYSIFLFNNSDLVNGLLGGYNSTAVPDKIKALPALTVTTNAPCSPLTVNWSTITAAENTIEAPGKDNGYARLKDGICGTWDKTANALSHTPGKMNGSSSAITGTLLSTSETFFCGSSIQFSISSSSNTSAFPVDVHLYTDAIETSVLDANDTYIDPSQTINLGDNTTHSFTVPNSTNPYLLVYETALGCIDKIAPLSCVILPVKFQSFTAVRDQQIRVQVLLKWITASEQNNRGFYVQRKVTGAWKNIAFVFSQADKGNSSTPLAYEYMDLNTFSSQSQYRIQQVDMDGSTSYSEIKAVPGLDKAIDVLVYPNPSPNGKVNLLFLETNSFRDIMVHDLNGRLVKQFRQLTKNNLIIDGLQSGFYTIKITDHATSTTTVEKVIIK